MKKLFTIFLLAVASFAWSDGIFEQSVKQWNDFKKRPLLLSGEPVMWKAKIWNSWHRYDYGDEIVIQAYLIPRGKLSTNKREFPFLIICNDRTKFLGSKFDPKFNPNVDPTFGGGKLDKNDIVDAQGRLACINAGTGLICLTAEAVVDEGSN